MASQPDLSAQPREPLSRERVLSTAISVADESGIDALSMRKLAQVLGVEAMSLYYHVSKKDDLLDGIVDIVVSEFALPADGPDWKSALRQSAISAHHALLRHPWACQLLASATVRPSRLRYMDSILKRLRQSGFSVDMTHHAYHALDSHIIGFTLWEVGFPAEPELMDLAANFLQELPVDDYPYVAEHIRHHLTGVSDDDQPEFEFGLDLILDGLDRLRTQAALVESA